MCPFLQYVLENKSSEFTDRQLAIDVLEHLLKNAGLYDTDLTIALHTCCLNLMYVGYFEKVNGSRKESYNTYRLNDLVNSYICGEL